MVPEKEKNTEPAGILLVDDDRLVLSTLATGLRHAGFDVQQAESAEEAMECAASRNFDLAILDMRMPGLSGSSLANWLRQNTGIPFLFLSAYSDAELVTEAVREGALTYLVKPIQVEQIVPAIKAALQRAGEIRQLRETTRQLDHALQGSRDVSVAMGVLMGRTGLTEEECLARLKDYARRNRKKLAAIARELVETQETCNRAVGSIMQASQA